MSDAPSGSWASAAAVLAARRVWGRALGSWRWVAIVAGWVWGAGWVRSAEMFVPSNPPEMARLTVAASPAHAAAKKFLRGVNLGNYLEAPPGQDWGVRCEAREFARMRGEGFDHVRVPVGWHHYAGPGPGFELRSEIFDRVDFVVTNALANRLAVIVNLHHFEAFTRDPTGQEEKFVALWRQIAGRYAGLPDAVGFELLNEPNGAATTAVMNPILARTLKEVRRTNPTRTVFIGPGGWNNVGELKHLVLPADDDRLIVTVHCYEPFYFTHQGAAWAGPDTKVKGIVFPGPPGSPLAIPDALEVRPHVREWIRRYNNEPAERNPSGLSSIEWRLRLARDWGRYYGRPVHVGEFGCYTTADAESRGRFHATFRSLLDELDLGWALWDWSAGFRYWDKGRDAPAPGMREALFGAKPESPTGLGRAP